MEMLNNELLLVVNRFNYIISQTKVIVSEVSFSSGVIGVVLNSSVNIGLNHN